MKKIVDTGLLLFGLLLGASSTHAQCGVSTLHQTITRVPYQGKHLSCLGSRPRSLSGTVRFGQTFYADLCSVSELKEKIRDARHRSRRRKLAIELQALERSVASRTAVCNRAPISSPSYLSPAPTPNKQKTPVRDPFLDPFFTNITCWAEGEGEKCVPLSYTEHWIPDFCITYPSVGVASAPTIAEAEAGAISECYDGMDDVRRRCVVTHCS